MSILYFRKHTQPTYPTYSYISLGQTLFNKLPHDLHTLIYKRCYQDVIIELQTLFFDYQDHMMSF